MTLIFMKNVVLYLRRVLKNITTKKLGLKIGRDKMKKVYSKKYPDILLGIIHKFDEIPKGRVDIAPDEQFIQVSSMRLDKKAFRPHKHIWKDGEERVIPQESWVCMKGSVKVTMYDFDDTIIDESVINVGDISVTFEGGHTYDILEDDTIVYEYKTGPYKGQENDKVFI